MHNVSHKTIPALIAASALIALDVSAATDPDAPVVLLRSSCSDINGSFDNCFTDLSVLNAWIADTRRPTAGNPLLVEIGPGTFPGMFSCNDDPEDPGSYGGYVTLRGSGKDNTTITNSPYPISTVGCKNLVFSDMTVTSTSLGVQGSGSNTSWYNVEVRSSGNYAWFDSAVNGCYLPTPGKHYWYSSRIVTETSGTTGEVAYKATCDESWFYGSEIVAISNAVSGGNATAIKLDRKRAEVHVYGSVIRALAGGDSPATLTPVVVDRGSIHIHGTGIDAVGKAGNPIVALSASNNGHIHANVSSYFLSNGTGTSITRVSNNGGHVHAPYLWEFDSEPPAVSSVDGFDMAVATSANGEPQLLVNSSTCPSNWYDIGSKACRP